MIYFRIVLFILFIYIVYRAFFAKPRTYSQVISRAVWLEMLFMRKRALHLREKFLLNPAFNRLEQASLLKAIGLAYYKTKEYGRAVHYFDELMEQADEYKFYYDSTWNNVILAYVKSGQPSKARAVYTSLLARRSFDPNFNKLKKIEGLIN